MSFELGHGYRDPVFHPFRNLDQLYASVIAFAQASDDDISPQDQERLEDAATTIYGGSLPHP